MSQISNVIATDVTLNALGLLAVVVSVGAYGLYITDCLRRRVRPSRASWLIWTVLACMLFISVADRQSTLYVAFVGVHLLGASSIFLISLWQPSGGIMSRTDFLAFGAAAGGAAAWVLDQAVFTGLTIAIVTGAIAGLATVAKGFRAPQSERLDAWVFMFMAALSSILPFAAYGPELLAFPLGVLGVSAAVCASSLMSGQSDAVGGRARPTVAVYNIPNQITHDPMNDMGEWMEERNQASLNLVSLRSQRASSSGRNLR